jgi:hypothetical protein
MVSQMETFNSWRAFGRSPLAFWCRHQPKDVDHLMIRDASRICRFMARRLASANEEIVQLFIADGHTRPGASCRSTPMVVGELHAFGHVRHVRAAGERAAMRVSRRLSQGRRNLGASRVGALFAASARSFTNER